MTQKEVNKAFDEAFFQLEYEMTGGHLSIVSKLHRFFSVLFLGISILEDAARNPAKSFRQSEKELYKPKQS